MNFRNTKIKIKSPEHSEAFQKAVFEAGGHWLSSGDRLIKHTHISFLFVDDNLHISRIGDDEDYYKEIYFPEPIKVKRHVHAELMAQYAEDAKNTDEPWQLWQENLVGYWQSCVSHPSWRAGIEYRRKPKVKIINGVGVPDIAISQSVDEMCYFVAVDAAKYYRESYYVESNSNKKACLERGLVYPYTEEGKQAAIRHAKALLGIKE